MKGLSYNELDELSEENNELPTFEYRKPSDITNKRALILHTVTRFQVSKAILNPAMQKASPPLKTDAQFLAQTKESTEDFLGRNEHLRSLLKQWAVISRSYFRHVTANVCPFW